MQINSHEVKEIGRFINARREATDAAKFPEINDRRRHVKHLTQSDLADLVGISTVVISQIEQGRYPNLSSVLLQRISQALGLTQQQRLYLLSLFEERPSQQESLEPAPAWISTSISQITHPVLVVNPAFDIVAINNKGKAFFGTLSAEFAETKSGAVSIFRLPDVRTFIIDWEAYAASLVSGIKMSYAVYPAWRDYIDALALQLESTDERFTYLWNQADPLVTPTIEKQFNHSSAGVLNVMQILTGLIEVPGYKRIDFTPADDETRRKIGMF